MKNFKFSNILIFFLILTATPTWSQSLNWWASFGSYNAQALDSDNAGNVYLGGELRGTIDADPGTGYEPIVCINAYDGFLVKLNSAGGYEWDYHLYGNNNGQSIHACETDTTGNVFMACDFSLHSMGVRKLNASGNVLWTKIFNYNSSSNTNYNNCFDIALDSIGNAYVTGDYYGNTTFSVNPPIYMNHTGTTWDPFIAKIDSTGNTLWAKGLHGTGEARAWSLALDDSANIYITGVFDGSIDFDPDSVSVFTLITPGTTKNMYVLKLNPDGEFMWVHQFSTHSYLQTDIKIDHSNNILVCGFAPSITDFDPGPGVHYPYGFPSNYGYVLKLDSDGNFIWVVGFDGSSSNIKSVDFDSFDNIIACGTLSSYLDLDPGTGTDTVWNNTAYPQGFIVRLSQNGNYLGGGSLISTNKCTPTRVSYDPSGSFFVAGEFVDTLDIDPDTSFVPVIGDGTYDDLFLAKYSTCGYSSSTQFYSGCDTLWVNGVSYIQDGTYFQTYQDTAGCDSTIILDITVNHDASSSTFIAGCDSISLNGQTYFSSGVYFQYLQTIAGCDSILVVTAEINSSSSSSLILTGCDSVVVNSIMYSSTGIYIQNLTTAAGCDSILSLNITIISIDTSITTLLGGFSANQVNAGYQWMDCDNGFTAISGAMNQQFFPAANGNYAVMLNYMGCSDTSLCFNISNVGIEEVNIYQPVPFPNPVSEIVYIRFPESGLNVLVEISDLQGRVVNSIITETKDKIGIDVSELNPGCYLLKAAFDGIETHYPIVVWRN